MTQSRHSPAQVGRTLVLTTLREKLVEIDAGIVRKGR
jgi:hypothetical protein